MKKTSWKDYAKLAEHYHALDMDEIYLNDVVEKPWHLINEEIEQSGYSIYFKAYDPASKLSFRWTVSKFGYYIGQYDITELLKACKHLPKDISDNLINTAISEIEEERKS